MPYKDPDIAKQKRKEYYEKNRERLIEKAKEYNRTHAEWYVTTKKHSQRKVRYGISAEEYQVLMDKQQNLCAICLKPSKVSLCVDHDHTTGKVRGLLCFNCNSAIGMIRDELSNALRLYEYLKDNQALKEEEATE